MLLKIMIMTTNSGKLIVCNNLQRKVRNVSSNKVGISNIINKYRLMNQEEIMVNDNGKEFLVVIPLLQVRETSTLALTCFICFEYIQQQSSIYKTEKQVSDNLLFPHYK